MQDACEGVYEQLFELFGTLKQGIMATHPHIEADGLTRLRLGALGIMSRGKPMPASELARLLRISKPQTTALVDGLVASGLATREESKEDRRVALVSMTEAGRSVLARAMCEVHASMRDRLARLDEGELRLLRDSLESLVPLLRKLQE